MGCSPHRQEGKKIGRRTQSVKSEKGEMSFVNDEVLDIQNLRNGKALDI